MDTKGATRASGISSSYLLFLLGIKNIQYLILNKNFGILIPSTIRGLEYLPLITNRLYVSTMRARCDVRWESQGMSKKRIYELHLPHHQSQYLSFPSQADSHTLELVFVKVVFKVINYYPIPRITCGKAADEPSRTIFFFL